MTTSFNALPGQTITLCIQVVDNTGKLHDGYQAPTLDFIKLPNGSSASGYPVVMTEIITGIWKISLVIPSGITAIGTYICSISYPDPDTAVFQNELFLINVILPFGVSSVTPA